jgi:hypothetical protein
MIQVYRIMSISPRTPITIAWRLAWSLGDPWRDLLVQCYRKTMYFTIQYWVVKNGRLIYTFETRTLHFGTKRFMCPVNRNIIPFVIFSSLAYKFTRFSAVPLSHFYRQFLVIPFLHLWPYPSLCTPFFFFFPSLISVNVDFHFEPCTGIMRGICQWFPVTRSSGSGLKKPSQRQHPALCER